jgi:protein phosphatase
MNAWGITDIGLVRRENQDAYAIRQEMGYTLCVVCDGMGGAKGGRVASTLASETFLSVCLETLRPDMDPEGVQAAAEQAVVKANAAVYQRSREDQTLRGMGTTLVSAIARGDWAVLCNVGDSRAYLLPGDREKHISRVTKDHSLVERLVEMGNITAEEARRHPDRNLITRALGPEPSIAADSYQVTLSPGDCLLLCSDGLIETATDQELEQALRDCQDPEECLRRLLELAKSQGAPDNVTAVLLR